MTQPTGQYQETAQAGAQASLGYIPGAEVRGLTLLTTRPLSAEKGYRVVVTGSNVLISIRTGTSDTNETTRIVPPARFVAHGSIVVFARVDDADLPADARVMVGEAYAGEVPDVAGQETGPVDLQPSAVAVRALTACTLTVRGVAVSLIAGQAIELRGAASLDTGTATVLYEP